MKIILTTLLVLLSANAFAQDGRVTKQQGMYGIADRMAECASLDILVSEILVRDPMLKDHAAPLQQSSRDWRASAAWTLFSSNTITNWQQATQYADNKAVTILKGYETRVASQDPKVLANIEGLKSQCEAMKSLQAQNLMAMQKNMGAKQ